MSSEHPPSESPVQLPTGSADLGKLPGLVGIAGCLAFAAAGGMAVAHATGADVLLPTVVGLAAGGLAVRAQRHPRRALGLIPYGALGILVAVFGLAVNAGPAWCVALLGFAFAFVAVPFRFPIRDSSARGSAVVMLGGLLAAVVSVGILGPLMADRWVPFRAVWPFVATAGIGTVLAGWLLYHECLEQTAEVLLLPIYRIRASGPGKHTIPRHGPVLIVSNHTAWFDPLWLGKVIPRRIIPLMGSGFYDLPVMRWLMVHVVGAIRVQESGFRREVPELDEAVAALDRGECVVIFPEGRVRRKEEQPLRQFGQGVWHILQRRPQTPVVVCWIEGGWGSYFSYWNGPPMKNKRFDWWRRIRIGIHSPQVLDPAVLAEHRATRAFLREACLEARRHLGLEPHVVEPQGGKEDEDAGPGSVDADGGPASMK